MAGDHEREREALRGRLHILEALLDALGRMNEVDAVIRSSSDRQAARRALTTEPFNYSEVVANHILDMPVARQTVAGVEELRREVRQARTFLEESDDS
jgi:DNA gyrase subunit A